MIALRNTKQDTRQPEPNTTLDSYHRVVLAVEEAGSRAYPPAAEGFRSSLQALRRRLTRDGSARAAAETATLLEGKLKVWSSQVASFFDERSAELKDVELPTVCKDTDKAEMLLGYLARSEKEQISTASEGAST